MVPESSDRPQAWTLRIEPRDWQSSALAKWRSAGRRGVIKAATGTGKTVVAMAAIAELRQEFGADLRVAIVVPQIALAGQWNSELRDKLYLSANDVGEMHSANNTWQTRDPVLITVMATARRRLPNVMRTWNLQGRKVLLIVDECHHVGGTRNINAFTTPADFTLGLSATPERPDGRHETHVLPTLGPVVDDHALAKAIDQGDLADVISIDLYVDFSSEETDRWGSTSLDLGRALAQLYDSDPSAADLSPGALFTKVGELAQQGDRHALLVSRLLVDRKELVNNSANKQRLRDEILDWIASSSRRPIFFHESIRSAGVTYNGLIARNVPAGMDHSGLRHSVRKQELSRFREGDYRAFVAVRALDEGVDIPSADVGVITSGTKTTRQRVQRIGRVLRRAEDKQALVITILVRGTPEESFVGAIDDVILGQRKTRHHRWPAKPLLEALPDQAGHCGPSTYRPRLDLGRQRAASRYSETVHALTARTLGLSRPQARDLQEIQRQRNNDDAELRQRVNPNRRYPKEEARGWIPVSDDEFDRLLSKASKRVKADRLADCDGGSVLGATILVMWKIFTGEL